MGIYLVPLAVFTLIVPGIITESQAPFSKSVQKDLTLCQRVQQPGQSIAACSRLLKRKSYSDGFRALAYTRRGQSFARKRNFKKALADFSMAISLKEGKAESYFHRGAVHSLMRDHNRAVADYSKVIALNPDYAMAYYNRGTALFRQGYFQRAQADFDRMIALKPSFWRAFINRGTLFIKLGNIDKALDDFDKALSLNPGSHAIMINRAALHLKSGDKEKAFKDYRAALKLSENQNSDRHGHIRNIQKKLKKLGFYHGNFTGVFDLQTDKALQKWLLNTDNKQ